MGFRGVVPSEVKLSFETSLRTFCEGLGISRAIWANVDKVQGAIC